MKNELYNINPAGMPADMRTGEELKAAAADGYFPGFQVDIVTWSICS